MPGGATGSSLPTLISQTKGAIQKLGTEVRNGLGVGTPPASSAAAEPAGAGAQGRASHPAVTPRRAGDRQPPVTLLESVQLVPPHQEQPVTEVPLVDLQPTIDPPAQADDSFVEGDGLSAIYSSNDPDVRPPVLLYPQLPAPLMADRRPEAVNRMELVVSESGTVEHVRLVAGPRRMPDMMLLSGAKMWRFRPAVKDGEPVRYRTVVSWIGVP